MLVFILVLDLSRFSLSVISPLESKCFLNFFVISIGDSFLQEPSSAACLGFESSNLLFGEPMPIFDSLSLFWVPPLKNYWKLLLFVVNRAREWL